jgi:hypothetical protein
MRPIVSLVAGMLVHAVAGQDLPRNAIAVSLGVGLYPEMKVDVEQGGSHARFPFDPAWGAAISYRRSLSPKWTLAGTVRADHVGYYFLWSGNMDAVGHWAIPGAASVGLPPQEFTFFGVRGDLGHTLWSSGPWSIRAEAGMELLFVPYQFHGQALHTAVNGQVVGTATTIGAVLNDDDRPMGRLRVAFTGGFRDRRYNEWVLGVAGLLAFRENALQGSYIVSEAAGGDRGTFRGRMNALEVSVARYFSWGRPKLPRWVGKGQIEGEVP